jgi:hypothetical protein
MALDLFSSMKRYFSELSNRNGKGNLYCSLILVQNIMFHEFINQARSILINLDFSLFPTASDHEELSEIGWLLYSTRYAGKDK